MKKELKLHSLARIVGYFELKGNEKKLVEKIAQSDYSEGLCDSLVAFLKKDWKPHPGLLDSLNGVKKADFDAFLQKRIQLRNEYVNEVQRFPLQRMGWPGIAPMAGKDVPNADARMLPGMFAECEDSAMRYEAFLEWLGILPVNIDPDEEYAIKRLLADRVVRDDIATTIRITWIKLEQMQKKSA